MVEGVFGDPVYSGCEDGLRIPLGKRWKRADDCDDSEGDLGGGDAGYKASR